ncbi:hypothetical protein ACFLTB_04170 [Chloroflexota bacterium]
MKMVKRYKTKAELESTVIRIFRTDQELLRNLAETHGWSIGEAVSLILNSIGDDPILPDKVPAHQLQMAGFRSSFKNRN